MRRQTRRTRDGKNSGTASRASFLRSPCLDLIAKFCLFATWRGRRGVMRDDHERARRAEPRLCKCVLQSLHRREASVKPPRVRTAAASFLRQLDYSLRGGCNVPNEDPPCERDSPGLIMR